MKCNECEYFWKMQSQPDDTDVHGVCSLPESFVPTIADQECVFLAVKPKSCKDCSHFGNDFGCLSAQEDDEICSGFEDVLESRVTEAMFEWLKRGEYSRRKLELLCIAFEQTDVFRFVTEHQPAPTQIPNTAKE